MLSLKQIVVIAIIAVFIGVGGFLKIREFFLPTASIKIAGQILEVELAQTPFAWEKGLSGRKKLASDRGMLFVFPQTSRQAMWMKGMKFPLDIIWIAGDKVVDIAPEIKPAFLEPPSVYLPRLPARLVLEVNAGFSKKYDLKIGDEIRVLTKGEE